MANILIIVAQNDFRDVELLVPMQILQEAKHVLTFASIKKGHAQGTDGTVVNVEAIKDQNIAHYDCVMVIGGSGASALANYPEVLKILQDAKTARKTLAATCIAPTIFANACVLKARRATVFETAQSKKILEEGGATFVKQTVVVQPGLITGNSPTAAEEFGKKVAEMLH